MAEELNEEALSFVDRLLVIALIKSLVSELRDSLSTDQHRADAVEFIDVLSDEMTTFINEDAAQWALPLSLRAAY